MSAFDLRGAVTEFHVTYGHPVRDSATLAVPDHELDLGVSLIAEELTELNDALEAGDLIEVADAIGDVLWVVESLAVRLGINTDRVLREVQESNRTKLGEDGKPIYNAEGKIQKGPGFVPPNIPRALDTGFEYPEERELDPSVDLILAPSGGLAAQYIPVEYPHLAQLRVITPLSLSRIDRYPVRDVYVMKGIMVYHDWPEVQEQLEYAQRDFGGNIYALDC